MKIIRRKNQKGNGIVVVISVVATILAILGAAVSYTAHISRISQRSRRTALAMEIADGHLEYLFTNWRNIYRKTWITYGYQSGGTDYSTVGTNWFYTALYNPGNGCSGCPAPTPIPSPYASPTPFPTPPQIPTPAKSYFPTEANYTVTQYRIQACDPMIDLDANGNAQQETTWGSGSYTSLPAGSVPPPAYGPNTWQYSYYYLASVDVSVPALGTNSGTVTAKVRRILEKKFYNTWSYAIFYNDDLEFQPTASFTINGPVHTNGNLYIGSSNFTSQDSVEYGADYVNGYSPNDTSSHSGGISTPSFVSNMPPMQVPPYLPFGWNLDLSSSDTNPNNDSYHDIIERPNNSYSDALSNVRYYDQAGYRIVINADTSVTITKIDSSGNVTNVSGSLYNTIVGNNGQGSSTTILQQNQPLYDAREGSAVKVTNVDIGKLTTAITNNTNSINTGWTGLLYIADAGAGASTNVTVNGVSYPTTRRAIRLINGSTLPSSGLTVVSENPIYIQGNYNTGGSSPPSNSGTYTDPDVSGYTRKPAAVVGDAVNILSSGWSDANSAQGIGSRVASANTTVNAALVGGITPSSGGNYSGGGENFIRFLEDWSTKTLCYYGSMVELYNSQQATGTWTGNGTVFKSPVTNRWFYDDATFSGTTGPPGALQIAAYLQQQRWYQVY
jgi:hypothetical protein